MPASKTSNAKAAKKPTMKVAVATSPVPAPVELSPKNEPAPHHEGFKGLSVENWTPASFEQVLEEKVGAWVQYTRDTYVPRADFLKQVKENEEKGLGPIKKQRKKIMCLIKEVDEGTLKVESIPRPFKDELREQRVMSWVLRSGMKGGPKFYIQTVKSITV